MASKNRQTQNGSANVELDRIASIGRITIKLGMLNANQLHAIARGIDSVVDEMDAVHIPDAVRARE